MKQNIIDKLDMMAELILKDISMFNPIQYTTENQSITIVPNEPVAFALNPPKMGVLKDVVPLDSATDDGIVCRIVVGYLLATRMSENLTVFFYEMAHLINSGLVVLAKNAKNFSFRKVRIKRTDGKFFKELENYNGIELMLVLEKFSDSSDDIENLNKRFKPRAGSYGEA